jgi:periplasmic divalent cation tolerance protein
MSDSAEDAGADGVNDSADDDARVVLMTAPDQEVAQRIARTLVEERLAACVNLVPGVRSIYRWQGSVEDDAEILLLAKTGRARCAALAARVQALHPYELPEIVVLPVDGGSQRYLDWIVSESSP